MPGPRLDSNFFILFFPKTDSEPVFHLFKFTLKAFMSFSLFIITKSLFLIMFVISEAISASKNSRNLISLKNL